MVRYLVLSFLISISISMLAAQERVLLRIGANGAQEAIPLKKGEQAREVIRRLEQKRASLLQPAASPAGLIDTLRYFQTEGELTTNFGWTHQDVALQWFVPQSNGVVKEFWWLNYQNQGVIKKATIRAWHMDSRVAVLPASPTTKFIGSYKDALDGDGGVQPFKPSAGNQWFYSNGADDSTTYSFDPMKSEAKWLPGGFQVTLDSNAWQGITLDDWGDSMRVNLGEPFGFTISNDTKKSDIGAGEDVRMEILSKASDGAPYHSYKFYETGRTALSNAGWHLRGDYEWGMYVVVEYLLVPWTGIVLGSYGTKVTPEPREICAYVHDDNPGGGSNPPYNLWLFYKIGSQSKFDSLEFHCEGNKCCVTIPKAKPGDTTFWYVRYIDLHGNRTVTPVRTYVTFQKRKPYLFVYNNASFSRSNAGLIYAGRSNPSDFDYWSTPSDGTGELSALFDMYNDILIADGSFPSRNVYTALKNRIAKATEANPIAVFLTSQDYGCYIESNCADTSFAPGTLEYDYFGLSSIGPQDLPPTNKEFRIVPQSDPVTDYLIKYGTDSAATLWYDPTFELGFSGYQDAVVPRPAAITLFKDGGTHSVGVKYITPSVRTTYMGFDIGALQFRSDTSLAAGSDPKYSWVPTKVGSVADAFFKVHHVTAAGPAEPGIIQDYTLQQNYPNPFNPFTTIGYSVPVRSPVEVNLYNILGQRVAVLATGVHEPGRYSVRWDGSQAASGIYFYELRSGPYRSVKKMVLMK
jgi:hypothetical protein